jgi:hypothetical protein
VKRKKVVLMVEGRPYSLTPGQSMLVPVLLESGERSSPSFVRLERNVEIRVEEVDGP